ncbi:unnamed protein product [Lactuca saligna]|uniref:Uncharacterized protein n=1 Tax=Lactuca saligna TaxID=75948 RepID=A0AA35ZD07_LACSI|nr:unnamed protein product [Lactuca saligna]
MFFSLAASLPQFQCPFTTTTLPRSLELASAYDKETLDKSHSHIMEGMHLLNDVSARTKVQMELLSQRQEAQEFRERLSGLSKMNILLVSDLSESIHCRNELKNLNKDLHIKFDDAIDHRSMLAKALEEKTHQFESIKFRFTKMVSEMEISCSNKDVCIKMLEIELVVENRLLADWDAQILQLNQVQPSYLQNESRLTLRAKIRASELWWLV